MHVARHASPPGAVRGVSHQAGVRALTRGELAVVVLGAATALGMLVSIWAVFAYAPMATDLEGGIIQRIFYFHVPLAWDAFLAFFVVFVASVAYLWRRDERWDWLARAAAEIGAVFTALVLVTGSIWGKPFWGVWWIWDARLTTTLILWFIYVGYLMLRSYTGRSVTGARQAAVLGIVAFIVVPINYLSVSWWNSKHPPTTYVADSSHASGTLLTTFMLTLVTFTLFFALLLVLVYHTERVQSGLARLRGRLDA
jgi:heme exporter protein C